MKENLENRERSGRVAMRKGPEILRTDMLEFLPYEYKGQDISIETTTDEFTSVCPMTGLPDFGRLILTYTPGDTIVELKSLKYYLFQFREVGIFYEHLANRILEDLWQGLQPKSLSIEAVMTPRGGLATRVSAHRTR